VLIGIANAPEEMRRNARRGIKLFTAGAPPAASVTVVSAASTASVAEAALAWAQRNLKPEFRGDEESGNAFGSEMPVAADAPAGDRLAGFFGRDVAAWPA